MAESKFSLVLDFHNHLIPQVDDGSQSIEISRSAIAHMRDQGIKTIITTPHLRASMLGSGGSRSDYLERVDAGWTVLRERASQEFSDIRLERGFEILLDVPRPDLTDPKTRLGGTKFALTEFPFTSVPPHSARLLFDLRMNGYEPILAHPERYTEVQDDPGRLEEWIRIGIGLQVNAGSLIGNYGPRARKASWLFLERGWVSYVCSDYHASGQCATKAAAEALKANGGSEQVELLFAVNPERILREELPLPVPPLESRRSRLERTLRNILRR